MLDPVEFLSNYIACGSVSADTKYKEQVLKSHNFIAGVLKKLDFKIESCKTNCYPIILAKRHPNPDWPTILIYGHYDVQPADPFEKWISPPFSPKIKNNRIYGRGASDNKGSQVVHICALEQALISDPNLPLNITYLIEGEEEIGSPSFTTFLENYQKDLRGEFVLVSDTAIPSSNQLVITTGLRGLVILEITLKGPAFDLHSGVHGGAIRNPIQALCDLLSKLHDESGRILIDGFYDQVAIPSKWERQAMNSLQKDLENYQKFLDVPDFFSEKPYHPQEAIRFRPTLEINGIRGGYQGEGFKTVIPSKASAKISCRLVPNQDFKDIQKKIIDHLSKNCPKGTTLTISSKDGGDPYAIIPGNKTDSDQSQNSLLKQAFNIAEQEISIHFKNPPLFLREGGSVPIIADLKKILGLDCLMVGLTDLEDKIHSPNESFSIPFMKKGIKLFKAFFLRLAYQK